MKRLPSFPGHTTHSPSGSFVYLSDYQELREFTYAVLKQNEALTDLMQVIAKSLGCLPSYADPSPSGGNSHIIAAIEKLKGQIQEARTLLVNATPGGQL